MKAKLPVVFDDIPDSSYDFELASLFEHFDCEEIEPIIVKEYLNGHNND